MNTNPLAKRILCFGDSNTWGYIPASGERYPVDVRWTGLLQEKLGNNFEIIEEGLNSRTTDLDDPEYIGKNGLVYLRPCLETHDPIDAMILMLGTNDMKQKFHRQPPKIAEGVDKLIKAVKQFSREEETKMPEIILVSPPLIDETVRGVKKKFLGAEEKSKQLASLYEKIATKHHCKFIDASILISPSKKDGYHLDPKQHQVLSDCLYSLIIDVLGAY